MNKFYIVRHGQTGWNVLGLMQGRVDIELNETGILQAESVKKQIKIDEIDICYCSPLKRTKKTAEIIVDGKVEIIVDNMLIERNLGNFEGTKIDQDVIYSQWNYEENNSDNNLESIKDCLNRANEFLNKLNQKYDNKTILIVSHGSFIKALHFNLIGYDKDTDFLSFRPENGVLYEY